VSTPARLHLYEEITLLALREEAGTVIGSGTFPCAVAGALAAELLLAGRIRVDETRRHLVEVVSTERMGDPLLDECLQRIKTAGRRARLREWVLRFSRSKNLKGRAAGSLCRRGVLRVEEKAVLMVFRQKIYPEIDPGPEREIIGRLRKAIFTDTRQVDASTVVLVALAQAADLLKAHFPRGELRGRKTRIKKLTSGEVAGKATKEAIQGIQAAVMVAVMAAAIVPAATAGGGR
jgi:Golgi phosphoprotein 3